MTQARRAGWVVICLFCVIANRAAYADLAAVGAFYGSYEGHGVSVEGDVESKREMSVDIGPTDGGFFVKWSTTTFGGDGKPDTKSYSINFTRTRRVDIFASQMRVNKFGSRVPMDPMRGDPLIWARLIDQTLTVYAMNITADGSYDLQVYHRTLTEEGLDLVYSRFLEGHAIRSVQGKLKKISP